MVEVIGDVVIPLELITPNKATADLPSAPKAGTVYFDVTTSKLVFWTGAAYETVTSA